MLKGIQNTLNKFFNRKEFVIAVIFVLIAVALLTYTDSKTLAYDGYTGGFSDPSSHVPTSYSETTNNLAKQPSVLETSAQNVVPAQENAPMAGNYQLRPVNNPESLLPDDTNSDWSKLNPSLNAGSTPDLLQAGYHIGLDTIGQTLRNANLQLRSDPIIPKVDVGPWAQSTIEPDIARVPLEIGIGQR